MESFPVFGFISVLLLVSLVGISLADESPSYIAYVQGGQSSITNSTNGSFVLTVKDLIPYFHLSYGKTGRLIPVEQLINLTYPMNAALVFSGADNETIFMVEVVKVVPDANNVLTIQVKPLQYYEGEHLTSFNGKREGFEALKDSQYSRFAIYGEIVGIVPTNDFCEYEGCRAPDVYHWCTCS